MFVQSGFLTSWTLSALNCCTLICAYCNRGLGRFFFFFFLRALRKCSCHDRDSLSMLDPPPMIEFLGLHACSIRIKGRHALKWGTCSSSNTEQQYNIQYSGKTVRKPRRATYSDASNCALLLLLTYNCVLFLLLTSKLKHFSLPIRYTSDFPVPNSVSSHFQFQSLISSKPAAHSCFTHAHSVHNTAIQPVQVDLLAVAQTLL